MRVLFWQAPPQALKMIKTPYYLIDKQKLLVNMQKIAYVREQSGAKALLALKCFATRRGASPLTTKTLSLHGQSYTCATLVNQGQQIPPTNLPIRPKCGHNACPFLAGTAAGSQK